MVRDNLMMKIEERMKMSPKGTIFTNSDFYDISNPDAVKMALHRLYSSNKIYRLISGYYTIPYYSNVLHEYGYPSANAMAEKLAEKYAWNICPSGDTALNQIGLSTQVPSSYEFISDGPYRELDYLGQNIKFKHTTNRLISRFSKPLCLVIESIKAMKEENIRENEIMKLAVYCSRYVKEDIVLDTKSVPAWIHKILKKISEVTL